MFKSYSLIIACGLIVLSNSCIRNNKPIEGQEITVNIKRGESIQLSEFCASISYIILEQDRENFIGTINKLVKHADTLYIFDEKKNVIHKYNIRGTFSSNFSNYGKGPGEFIKISDFIIDTINNRIEIIDIGNSKIVTTDYNWNFLSQRKKPGYLKNFEIIAPNTYIYYASNYIDQTLFKNGQSKNIVITDSNNNILGTYMPIFHKNYYSSEPNQMVKCGNGVLVVTPLSNKIYFANKEEFFLKYLINFKRYNVDEKFDYLSKIDDNNIEELSNAFISAIEEGNKNTYATNITNMYEIDNNLFFQFFLSNDRAYSKNGIYHVVHNFISGKTLVGIPDNDIDFGLFGTPLTMDNDTLYTVIYPYSLRRRITELEDSVANNPDLVPHIQKLKQLAGSKTDEYNPIIARIAFKTYW
jgi:hypothetical protein